MRRDLISKVMREMGRKGGKAAKGKAVKARMAALTPEQTKGTCEEGSESSVGQGKEKKQKALKFAE